MDITNQQLEEFKKIIIDSLYPYQSLESFYYRRSVKSVSFTIKNKMVASVIAKTYAAMVLVDRDYDKIKHRYNDDMIAHYSSNYKKVVSAIENSKSRNHEG